MKSHPPLQRPMIILSSVLSLTLAGFARADIEVVLEVSKATSSFSPGESNVQLEVVPAKLGDFDHDFNTLGEQEFAVTWKAPPGKCIEIAPPAGFDQILELMFWFQGGSQGAAGGFDDNDPIYSFSGLTGTAPTPKPIGPGEVFLAGPGGDIFGTQCRFVLGPGESFRFKSLTVRPQTAIPASYNETFSNRIIEWHFIQGTGRSSGSPSDPGQWIRIVDEVNPREQALKKRIKRLEKARKKALRSGNKGKAARLKRTIRNLRNKLKRF